MRNRVKRLDLVDRVPKELWTKVSNVVQKAVTKSILKKKKCKKARGCVRRSYKWLKREEKQKAKEKGKDIPN